MRAHDRMQEAQERHKWRPAQLRRLPQCAAAVVKQESTFARSRCSSMSRTTSLRPAWRLAGFTSAAGCLGRHPAPASLGQSASWAALTGHTGLAFDTVAGREVTRRLRTRQRVEPPIGTTDGEQPAAHNAVRVPVDQVVERVAGGDS